MKTSILTILLCFLVFQACNHKRNKVNGNQDNKEFISQVMNDIYSNSKSIYPEYMLSHFPEKLDNTYITHTEVVSPRLSIVRLDLTVKVDDKKDISELLSNSIANYKSTDSCLLVANRFATRDNYYPLNIDNEKLTKVNMKCYENLFPIPNFWQSDYTDNNTECKLKEGFTIYVVDSRKGIFVDEKYLSKNPYLPSEWDHGYSRGISVSEVDSVAIYWLIVW